MFYFRNTVWYAVLILITVNVCYAAEVSSDSLVQALSSMDLQNVKQKNDQEINDLMSKLTTLKPTTDLMPVANEKTVVSSNTGLDPLSQKIVAGNITTPDNDAKVKNGMSDKVIKSENTAKITNNDKGNELKTSGMGNKTSQDEVAILKQKISIIENELNTLIKLQKLAYENNSILIELGKNKAPQNKNNEADNKNDIKKLLKGKNINEDPSGFAYQILKPGTGNIGENNLIRLTVSEKTASGRTLSLARDITLRYSKNLPPIILKSIQHIGYGGEIKVVAFARYSYPKGDYPKGVTSNTPLIYMISIGVNS